MAVLKAKDILQSELKAIAGLLTDSIAIVETADAIYFGEFDGAQIDFDACYRGRVFSRRGELKWRRVAPSIVRVVFLGDEDVISDALDDCSDLLQGLKRIDDKLHVLWGERINPDPEWIEQVVPHRFSYPFDGGKMSKGRLAVCLEEWVDASGNVCFSRFLDLEEKEGS